MRKFYLKIVLPTILSILLFVLTIFSIIIPRYQENIMNGKREMIRELTNAALSILSKYENDELEGLITRDEAQLTAISRIQYLRYGDENKDYFWITDLTPRMVVHPFRPDLNGKELSNFTDPHGKKMFVEFVTTVKRSGEGYVDYMWQWKDDSLHIVPKLSYVKIFEPWNWVVGTGIYIEDVKIEIASLTKRLIWISIGISILIAVLLLYIFNQSLAVERKRIEAEEKLKESREKYRTLVEAATEGLIMIIGGKISFANAVISKMTGFSNEELLLLPFSDLISKNNNATTISTLSESSVKAGNFELNLAKKGGGFIEALVTSSTTIFYGRDVNIFIVKNISDNQTLSLSNIEYQKLISTLSENHQLIAELKAADLLLEQSISNYLGQLFTFDAEAPLSEAVKLMNRKKTDHLVLTSSLGDYMGIVTKSDIQDRILALNLHPDNPAYLIMSAPIVHVQENTSISDAMLLCEVKKINHLVVKDNAGKSIGMFSMHEFYHQLKNTRSFYLAGIAKSDTVEELKYFYRMMQLMICPLIDNDLNVKQITALTTAFSDAITKRVIELAIADLGNPPAQFAFISMGSEGRKEETFFTDQDNAIVFEDVQKGQEAIAKAYFLKLGEIVCNWLNDVGYTFCRGNIMAKNPQWCCPLATWQNYFLNWIRTPEPQNLLDATIFFDFRLVYGDSALTRKLQESVSGAMKNHPSFFYHLASNTSNVKTQQIASVSILADKNTETLDLKSAIIPLVMFARTYALKNDIGLTNTIERLTELKAQSILNASTVDELLFVYNFLMKLRFRTQSALLSNKKPMSNLLNTKTLGDMEHYLLKKTLSTIPEFMGKVKQDFRIIT